MAQDPRWVVLVVDDEPEVRTITRLVLGKFQFEGRGLLIIEAGSAREARQALAERSDIAVMLVDVVMESERAGLDLVHHVRQQLGNRLIRIIVRTGQPGQAPERDVVRDYDINDYREKTELTAARLEGAVLVALRGYRDLLTIEATRANLTRLSNSLHDAERAGQLQRALLAISDLSGSNLDMPDLLRGIHVNVGTLMHAENFYIVLHDPERDSFRFLYFADVKDDEPYDPQQDLPMRDRQYSLTWHLLRAGKPLRGSIDQLRRQVTGPLRSLGPSACDWLGVPMSRDGRTRGAVVVQTYRNDQHYTQDDSELLEFVADHILTAVERKQAREDLERRVRERTTELRREVAERERSERLQASLFQIAQLATVEIDEAEFFRRIHVVVGNLIDARNFYVALLSADHRTLDFPYFSDHADSHPPSRRLGRGLSEWVLAEGMTCLDASRIREWIAQRRIDDEVIGRIPSSWLGVPLSVHDEAIGLIVVQAYDADTRYGPAEQELFGFVAGQVASSLTRRRSAELLQRMNADLERRVNARTAELRQQIEERERVQNQLQHEVLHDGLTGLPNRGYLRDRLERVIGLIQRNPDRHCALLFIDFDRFKQINDSLGHLVGDQVLKEFAARLLTCVRDPDMVARLSGDEFAILLEDVPVPSTGVKVAQRILRKMRVPMRLADTDMVFSASIGIAFGDNRYHRADDLLRDADSAMYRAKHNGRGRFELFDQAVQATAVDTLKLEAELRAAIANDQFEPWFQPFVDLRDGRIVGYEALLRWNHPERGVLAPGAFLSVAEDSGCMDTIDWRMYELSCARATQVLEEGMQIALNVAPWHFRRDGFGERLLQVIQRSGLPPQRVLVELTEGSLIQNPEVVRQTLEFLHGHGIGASLDDFGTGYSSLSRLHAYRLQVLKIDRTFVVGLGTGASKASTSVAAAVLALARALEMDAVAEGIETAAQRDALLALGCRIGQGYLLGRPAPLAHWLGLRQALATTADLEPRRNLDRDAMPTGVPAPAGTP